jgi:hypothetical protein
MVGLHLAHLRHTPSGIGLGSCVSWSWRAPALPLLLSVYGSAVVAWSPNLSLQRTAALRASAAELMIR